jgi:hypothetical protein
MKDESPGPGGPQVGAISASGLPAAVDRAIFQAELDRLRIREKAHTREPGGRPIAQWPRLDAGRSDGLTVGPR